MKQSFIHWVYFFLGVSSIIILGTLNSCCHRLVHNSLCFASFAPVIISSSTENYTWAKFFIPGLVFQVNQHKLRLFQLFRFNSGNQTLKENFSFLISKPWLLRKLLSIIHGGNRWGRPRLVTASFSRSLSELIPYKECSSKAIFNKLSSSSSCERLFTYFYIF